MYILIGLPNNHHYYVYVLTSPITNKPFYVGKGSNHRYLDHFKEAATNKTTNKHKTNTINQILQQELDVIINIVFTSDNENECYIREQKLIENFGRKNNGTGILVNKTDGGEGVVGVDRSGNKNSMYGKTHSTTTKQKIAATRIKRLKSGELVATKHTKTHKQKLRKSNPGAKATSKQICQISPKTGKIIKRWPSTRQAGLGLGIKSWRNISQSANKFKGRLVGGFYWRWPSDKSISNGKLTDFRKLNKHRKDRSLHSGIRIQQLSSNNEVIAEWKNMCIAARELSLSNSSISHAIKHNKIYAGFFWKKCV